VGASGFCGPCVCLGVFLCCSGEGLCQGLQETGVVYSWYGRLVSECVRGRSSVVTG
jgi:hypothetical protein